MIIDFGGISYKMGPRYPEIPADWETLAGAYARYDRLASGNAGRIAAAKFAVAVDSAIIAGCCGAWQPFAAYARAELRAWQDKQCATFRASPLTKVALPNPAEAG